MQNAVIKTPGSDQMKILPKNTRSSTEKPLFRYLYMHLLILVVNIVIILTLCGCSTYNNKDKDIDWINKLYTTCPQPYNPNFVFDSPSPRHIPNQADSQHFYRNPWPTSTEARKYISTDEVITYSEEYYSNQRQDSNQNLSNNYNIRIRGYRSGYSYR